MIDDELLGKKGLFAFSDPGGAKAILALIDRIKKSGYQDFVVISNRWYDFYDEFNIKVEIIDKDIPEYLGKLKIDYIFTGTSYTTDLELRCIRYAKKNDIESYSFVDHWTSIKDRFRYKNNYVFPDKVLVIDQSAYDIALKEKLPEDLLEICENPYIKYLECWKPAITKEEFISRNRIEDPSITIISYLAEPLSNVGGKDEYGLDEYSCLDFLHSTLSKLKSTDFLVLIKPHPNQDKKTMAEKARDLFNKNGMAYKIIEEDTNTVIFYSDLVIGIFSNALIEASIFKKTIFRILKGLKINDPLEFMNIGTCVFSEEELLTNLNQHF